jgi:hypothetical protein
MGRESGESGEESGRAGKNLERSCICYGFCGRVSMKRFETNKKEKHPRQRIRRSAMIIKKQQGRKEERERGRREWGAGKR